MLNCERQMSTDLHKVYNQDGGNRDIGSRKRLNTICVKNSFWALLKSWHFGVKSFAN